MHHSDCVPHLQLALCGLKIDLDPLQNLGFGFGSVFPQITVLVSPLKPTQHYHFHYFPYATVCVCLKFESRDQTKSDCRSLLSVHWMRVTNYKSISFSVIDFTEYFRGVTQAQEALNVTLATVLEINSRIEYVE